MKRERLLGQYNKMWVCFAQQMIDNLLDEISEMPLLLQAKLLRVLQEKRVMAVGGSNETPVDVRIIATTNRDMREEVKLAFP